MKVKAFREEFKGHDILAIWEVNDAGERLGRFPVISFGAKKAEAILECIDELHMFVGPASDPQLKALTALRSVTTKSTDIKLIDDAIEKRRNELAER